MEGSLVTSLTNDFVSRLKRSKLDSEIIEYCRLNKIDDISEFCYKCMLNGFNIARYGISPSDNIKRQCDAVEVEPVVKKKRKIIVKNND